MKIEKEVTKEVTLGDLNNFSIEQNVDVEFRDGKAYVQLLEVTEDVSASENREGKEQEQ